ncbi:ATP-binding protein [Caenispirillum bisanense]|uniref:histidine kinase n=1 Tax=Caenispirillum bisanense TaxID=414052 RepID=A0A286G113_9PROT|nr:ATP-binding protein [Caenispirillum bisanense]SOD89231.1 Signal transduction histidine kinase [Caenispirillum bisanense]
MPPPRLSLTHRLIAAAVLVVVIGCALGAVALDHAFREAQAHRLTGKLDLAARVVAAAVVVGPDGEPRLEGPGLRETDNGTWYWQVAFADGTTLRSATLRGAVLPQEDLSYLAPGAVAVAGYDDGPGGEEVVTAETRVVLPDGTTAQVKVALADREMRAALARFRSILVTIMVLLTVGLAAAIAAQVRWGLAPVRRVLADLRKVGEGEGTRLNEDVPRELLPLVGAFNDVLDANRRTVERSRGLAGNLAHALKTEIAVLRSEVSRQEPQGRKVVERRLATMTDLVERHLGRGGLAGVTGSGASRTDTLAALGEICTMLDKVYGPQGRDIALEAGGGVPDFRGDRDDFVEMVGNLVENACKHARSAVRVSAAGQGDRLLVRVEDDGPGLPAERRAEALKRGTRLDEQVPGSGLGLAIVADLVDDYGGTVTLGDSDLGGLAAELLLPAMPPLPRVHAPPGEVA